MRSRSTWGAREYCSIGLVLLGHACLLVLFAQARQRERSDAQTTTRGTLILIDSSSPTLVTESQPKLAVPRVTTLLDIPPPTLPAEVIDATSTAAPTTITRPSIDWRGEAQRSASRAIETLTAPQPRGFEERAPASREPRPRDFNWDPSPSRFGVSGGLPYMELGKRCVIGLGFFACSTGELPKPDGSLFEGMDDPNRPRESVPE